MQELAYKHGHTRTCVTDVQINLLLYQSMPTHHTPSQSVQSSVTGDITVTDDTPIPSRLGLGKNFSIISTENLPLTVATAETPTTQYPYVLYVQTQPSVMNHPASTCDTAWGMS